MELTLKDYINGVENGDLEPYQVVNNYLDNAKQQNKDIFSYVRFHEDYINDNISDFSKKDLKAAPIGIKDIILTKGYTTSCSSKMLEDYKPAYSASCFENLEDKGGLMMGKTNMDEFAMGSSTENSYFGKTKNPYGENRIPGGSSGGSAAAVASDSCIAALGTDTGGSIRQPASMCGVVGLKPTYGTVSRYGVQAMASSLDQVGTFTKTVEDASILLKSISGKDEHDATSIGAINQDNWDNSLSKNDLTGVKVAVPKQFFGEGLEKNVKDKIYSTIENIKELGAEVEWIDLPILDYVLSIYYILMPAEVSTNLARFDGVRFGYQEDSFEFDNIKDYYSQVRSKGFQEEVKRRILMGTYVLSAGYYDAYYLRAQKARKKLKNEFDKLFEKYDVVVGPVSPTVAWKFGEKTDDPLKMYLSDIYTIPANLAGLPAMSLPVGEVEENGESLPVGFHIMANQFKEENIFRVGNILEQNL